MGNWCYFTPFISGVISPPLITGDFGLTLDTPELLSALRFALNPCANVACSSCAVGQFVAGDSLKGRAWMLEMCEKKGVATVDGRNPANQLVGSLSHCLQGFIHCRWCRISAINRSTKRGPFKRKGKRLGTC